MADPLFWLDTNAYFLLYEPSRPGGQALRSMLERNGLIACAVSEITSMEIHSVLGKSTRTETAPHLRCERLIQGTGGAIPCTHLWIPASRPRLNPRLLASLHKLIRDAEAQRGPIRVQVKPVPPTAFRRGRQYLQKYAVSIPVGSHDALIAASVAEAQAAESSISIRLVTSDRGFKRLLQGEGIPHYDPFRNEFWPPSPAPDTHATGNPLRT